MAGTLRELRRDVAGMAGGKRKSNVVRSITCEYDVEEEVPDVGVPFNFGMVVAVKRSTSQVDGVLRRQVTIYVADNADGSDYVGGVGGAP